MTPIRQQETEGFGARAFPSRPLDSCKTSSHWIFQVFFPGPLCLLPPVLPGCYSVYDALHKVQGLLKKTFLLPDLCLLFPHQMPEDTSERKSFNLQQPSMTNFLSFLVRGLTLWFTRISSATMGVCQNMKWQKVKSHSGRKIQWIRMQTTPLLMAEPACQCSRDEAHFCSEHLGQTRRYKYIHSSAYIFKGIYFRD